MLGSGGGGANTGGAGTEAGAGDDSSATRTLVPNGTEAGRVVGERGLRRDL